MQLKAIFKCHKHNSMSKSTGNYSYFVDDHDQSFGFKMWEIFIPSCRFFKLSSPSIIVHYHPHHRWSSSFLIIILNWLSWQVYFYFTSEVQWELDSSHFRIKNPGLAAWKSKFISQEQWRTCFAKPQILKSMAKLKLSSSWWMEILNCQLEVSTKYIIQDSRTCMLLYSLTLSGSLFIKLFWGFCFFCLSCEKLSKVKWHIIFVMTTYFWACNSHKRRKFEAWTTCSKIFQWGTSSLLLYLGRK